MTDANSPLDNIDDNSDAPEPQEEELAELEEQMVEDPTAALGLTEDIDEELELVENPDDEDGDFE